MKHWNQWKEFIVEIIPLIITALFLTAIVVIELTGDK
jgi:hypothetical protein